MDMKKIVGAGAVSAAVLLSSGAALADTMHPTLAAIRSAWAAVPQLGQ